MARFKAGEKVLLPVLRRQVTNIKMSLGRLLLQIVCAVTVVEKQR